MHPSFTYSSSRSCAHASIIYLFIHSFSHASSIHPFIHLIIQACIHFLNDHWTVIDTHTRTRCNDSSSSIQGHVKSQKSRLACCFQTLCCDLRWCKTVKSVTLCTGVYTCHCCPRCSRKTMMPHATESGMHFGSSRTLTRP